MEKIQWYCLIIIFKKDIQGKIDKKFKDDSKFYCFMVEGMTCSKDSKTIEKERPKRKYTRRAAPEFIKPKRKYTKRQVLPKLEDGSGKGVLKREIQRLNRRVKQN